MHGWKPQQTPKAIDDAIAQVRYYSNALKINPLIIVPYLSEGALRLLKAEGVSGVDLNGNGILMAPEMAVRRSGEPDRYKTSQPFGMWIAASVPLSPDPSCSGRLFPRS